MSDDRLAAIEQKIDRLVSGQEELRSGLEDLRSSREELRSGQRDLQVSVEELRSGQRELQTGLEEVRAGQMVVRSDLETRIDNLDRRMHVLHEDVIGRIAALPTDVPTRAEMHRALADLNESIGRRLDPLEEAVRRLT